LNAKDSCGRTGYHLACQRSQVEIVELMIKNSVECNIDLNAKNEYDGKTGFHYACVKGRKVKLVELLIKNSVECNIDLNAKDFSGKTGFHYACVKGQISRVTDQKFSGIQYRLECKKSLWFFRLCLFKWSSQKVDTR
jgi:ankyrin